MADLKVGRFFVLDCLMYLIIKDLKIVKGSRKGSVSQRGLNMSRFWFWRKRKGLSAKECGKRLGTGSSLELWEETSLAANLILAMKMTLSDL